MKVVLVDNFLFQTEPEISVDLQPQLGLISLAAIAAGHGFDLEIYDPKVQLWKGDLKLDFTFYRRIAIQLLNLKPTLVGFTTLGCNFVAVVKVAEYIKNLMPDLPVILGGPHASILDNEILCQFHQFDAICRNEAETSFLQVLNNMPSSDFSGIPNVTFRNQDGTIIRNPNHSEFEDLEALPVPAYEKYTVLPSILDGIRVEAGRGCPYACSFCSTAPFFGRRFRIKSAERLAAELDHLNDKYGFRHFFLNHDLFTVSRKKVLHFCKTVQDRSYTWTCSARPDRVDRTMLDCMRKAGCTDIYFGVEAGSQELQKKIHKNLDISLVEPTIRHATEIGMNVVVSYITGFPTETLSEQQETLRQVFKYSQDDEFLTVTPQLHLLTPEPGTNLFNQHKSLLRYDGYITDFNLPLLGDNEEKLIIDHPEVFSTQHYYPTILPRTHNIQVHRSFKRMALERFGPVSAVDRQAGVPSFSEFLESDRPHVSR